MEGLRKLHKKIRMLHNEKVGILNIFCDQIIQLLDILGIIERNLPTFLPKIFSINEAPN